MHPHRQHVHHGYDRVSNEGPPSDMGGIPYRESSTARFPPEYAHTRHASSAQPPSRAKATYSTNRVAPKKHVVQSSALIAKSSQKRQTDDEILRKNPGLLSIVNADPTPRALSARLKILKYHDPNPKDGMPPGADHILFAWLPNAAWVGDTLSGYVFSVDGSKKPRNEKIGITTTPIVPEMFSVDKMLTGMLCIRLSNIKKNELGLNPIDSLELYPEKDMDRMLRGAIKDDADLSGEGSYAGFYISEDPAREWERNAWIVVSTGDKDISRTIHEYLKGDYNPSCSKDKRGLKQIVCEMQETLEQIKKASETSGIHQIMDNPDDFYEDEFGEDIAFSQPAQSKSSRRSKKKKKHKTPSYANDKYESSDTENKVQSTTDKLVAATLSEERRCAWKYAKLIKEIHRLTNAHAINAASSSPTSMSLEKELEEPECVKHRTMTWENHLMKESFIDGMLLRMKEKRWLVASKLANILGFDLIHDFDIDPFDKNIASHKNVLHVTVNTFVQNKRTAKMVYYAGSFFKHEMRGGLPVPISPVEGIHILKGPPLDEKKSKKKNISTSWTNRYCISSNRFNISSGTAPKSKDKVSSNSISSSESFESSDEDSEEDTTFEMKEIPGGEALRTFKLCSRTQADDDTDLGGQWLFNKESAMSIDCKGAFPYGTGRAMSYVRVPPPTTDKKNAEQQQKMNRMLSSGRLPGDVVQLSEWGPRGVWVIGGSEGPRARRGKRVLFTWGNTDYPSHPRLARRMFRERVKGFQTRETHMGWNPTFGSLSLQPKAIILHSPVNPL